MSRQGGVDWAALRQRLDAATRATSAGDGTSDAAQVLADRARRLAQPLAAPDPKETREIVSFRLARETYGIAADLVQEICRVTTLAPLPGAAPPIAGLTTWRGDLLLVLDLRRVLGLPAHALDDLRQMVVIDTPAGTAALLTDEVIGIVKVAPEELDAAVMPEQARARIRGVTRDAMIVLDAAALLRPHVSEES